MSETKIVVDTNAIVSALIAGGTPQRIIQGWINQEFLVVMSQELRHEINTALTRAHLIFFDSKRKFY